jgi:protein phosphatase
MNLMVPDFSLVVLVGSSGSGKSTFARQHFLPTEVLSSDVCRGFVSDDENDQAATQDAFEVLHFIAAKRLERRRLTVVDATNVQQESRRPFLELAREYHCVPVAIVLNIPERVCHERNQSRPDRTFGPHVVRQHQQNLKRSLRSLKREGFRYIYVLNSPEEVAKVSIERQPLWNDRRNEHGPFDIIGDVHGCTTELEQLLEQLGYVWDGAPEGLYGRTYRHPEGRKAVFVGDLVDRGPRVLHAVGLVRNMVATGTALCVPGNHDVKLVRKLRGKDVMVTHGLEQTLAEFDALPEDVRKATVREVTEFLDGLVSHYVLHEGKLVVAHAGMKEDLQGRASSKVRSFALYGETTGETDEFGLPVRHNWAAEYRGNAWVVYGHTPVPEPLWLNRTVNIDTGCVFGGALTALRYPELETVSVPAAQVYTEPVRPFLPQTPDGLSPQQQLDDTLDIEDVLGKRIITTRLHHAVTVRAEQSTTALEVMSRFVTNPKWLVYLPPTMSAPATSARPDVLEQPEEAFDFYRNQGITSLVCEEKHMGSRAVVVVCRDEEAAKTGFGVVNEGAGVIYTRTGRPFFNDSTMQDALLEQVRAALTRTGFWEAFETEWVVLDTELMPWSEKAQSLLEGQYAAVGAAARAAFPPALTALTATQERGVDAHALLKQFAARAWAAQGFTQAYRQYCWPVDSVNDLKLAPFHLLATEGAVHADKTNVWHLDTLRRYLVAEGSPSLMATAYRQVDLADDASVTSTVQWWEDLTGQGGEGMVVKPLDFAPRGKRGLTQPAIKVRGQEYLRIIYGPEYLLPDNLERLRSRNLSAKRSLALREFALGMEALERFVRKEPLRRVHECVFGVLALESEPVDARL